MEFADYTSECDNCTDIDMPSQFPVVYRVVATAVHGIILLGGICGNVLLIATILRTRCLQSPTYRFLVRIREVGY